MRQLTLAVSLVVLVSLVAGIGYGAYVWLGSAPELVRSSAPAISTPAVPVVAYAEAPAKATILMRRAHDQEVRGAGAASPAIAAPSPQGIETIAGGDRKASSLLEDVSPYGMIGDAGSAAELYKLALILIDPSNKDEDLDIGTGVTYLKVAAGLGEARAANTLGEIYSAGTTVQRDLVEAYLWYAVAAHQSSDPADLSAAEDRGEEIAAHMSAKELEQARALVAGWKPTAGPTLKNNSGLIMLAGDA